MAVTSFVRDRGRAFGVVAVMAMSVALLSAPPAFGAADGDPIETSTFRFKLTGAFKKQLRKNGVKMKVKSLRVSKTLNSDVDPITGKADLRLGTVSFKLNRKGKRICKSNTSKDQQCKRKVVYNNLKASIPGNVTSSQNGKLFKFKAARNVVRQGYGASLSGIKANIHPAAAKKLNRRFHLNSLKKRGKVANARLTYIPETVKIISGTAQTTSQAPNLTAPALGGSVGAKMLLGHCVNGTQTGFSPIAPATKELIGSGFAIQSVFRFPVVDGEISLDATEGLSETTGGIRIVKDITTGDCANGFTGELTQQGITTDISGRSVSSEVNIISAPPGVGTGPRGRAVGQVIDPTNTVVTIDPANRTFTLSGSIVSLAPSSATILNLVFPCAVTAQCDNSPSEADNTTLKGGDIFGTSVLTVTTR